jgi:hypothetical protein
MPAEVPVPVHTPPTCPLELRAISRGSSMRLFLEGAEVWCGMRFLGIVSAEWLASQVQERLQYIATTEWLKADLAADPTRRLGPPTQEETRPDVKAQRRAARRKNKGRRPTPTHGGPMKSLLLAVLLLPALAEALPVYDADGTMLIDAQGVTVCCFGPVATIRPPATVLPVATVFPVALTTPVLEDVFTLPVAGEEPLAHTPEPASLLLLGTTLAALGWRLRR